MSGQHWVQQLDNTSATTDANRKKEVNPIIVVWLFPKNLVPLHVIICVI